MVLGLRIHEGRFGVAALLEFYEICLINTRTTTACKRNHRLKLKEETGGSRLSIDFVKLIFAKFSVIPAPR